MKKLIVTIGLAGCCAAAHAQQAPSPQQATVALQNAMTREIQSMSANPRPGFDGNEATGVVRSLQVQSVENCQDTGRQSVVCDVRTSASVRGERHEDMNRYDFYQQGGQWLARLPAS